MIEVGHYDTSPNFAGDGFNGDWGVYPFFPSGNLICSDIERGLVILGPTYQRGCYLEGMISNVNTSPVPQATVIMVCLSVSDVTEFDGNYATVTPFRTYQVTVSDQVILARPWTCGFGERPDHRPRCCFGTLGGIRVTSNVVDPYRTHNTKRSSASVQRYIRFTATSDASECSNCLRLLR